MFMCADMHRMLVENGIDYGAALELFDVMYILKQFFFTLTDNHVSRSVMQNWTITHDTRWSRAHLHCLSVWIASWIVAFCGNLSNWCESSLIVPFRLQMDICRQLFANCYVFGESKTIFDPFKFFFLLSIQCKKPFILNAFFSRLPQQHHSVHLSPRGVSSFSILKVECLMSA